MLLVFRRRASLGLKADADTISAQITCSSVLRYGDTLLASKGKQLKCYIVEYQICISLSAFTCIKKIYHATILCGKYDRKCW